MASQTGLRLALWLGTGSAGSGCTLTCTVDSGKINAVTVTSGGSGYTTPPMVKITPTSGDTPTIEAVVTPVLTDGAVSSVVIVNGGAGYAHVPGLVANTPTPDNPISLVIDSDTLTSLESYRSMLSQPVAGVNGDGIPVLISIPLYNDVLSMIRTAITNQVVNPALTAFPTSGLSSQRTTINTAQQTISTIMTNSVATPTELIVVAGANKYVAHSVDASSWITGSHRSTWSQTCAWYGTGKFFLGSAHSDDCQSSVDGATWIAEPSLAGEILAGAYANGKHVAISYPASGPTNTLFTSTDGTTWTPRTNTLPWTSMDFAVGYALNQWFAGGHGKLLYSADAISWNDTGLSFGTSGVYGIAGTTTEAIIVTEDGVYKATGSTSISKLNGDVYHYVAYGNGVYVIGGDTGLKYSSNAGTTWNVAAATPWGTAVSGGIVFGDGQFFLLSSGVYTSSDGSTWKSQSGSTLYTGPYMPADVIAFGSW